MSAQPSHPATDRIEPLDEDFMADPYQLYRRMLEEGPVHRVRLPRGWQAWLVTRYAEARAALGDTSLSKDSASMREIIERHAPAEQSTAVFSESLAAHMLNSDPPDHTRLRKLVNKAFTSGRVEALRPKIEQVTADLLDDVAAAGATEPVDLLDAFAFPLPITVICDLLGVGADDRENFRAWSNTIVAGATAPAEDVAAAGEAMAAYLVSLVQAKRERPGEDLLSAVVTARDDGERLTENELVSMAFLLLVAGHETTVNLIGNGMLALLRDERQHAVLRADPERIPGAVEEFLRYESPVNIATLRHTTKPVRYGDVDIPAGELVLVALAAANRDPERFADPDTADVTRQAAGHLGFGHGIHYCVGAPLARMEAEIAFGALLTRFPRMRLAVRPDELEWRMSTLMRGLCELPVVPD